MKVTRWSDGLNSMNSFSKKSNHALHFLSLNRVHSGGFIFYFFTVLYIYCFLECTRFSTKAINQPLVSMPHYVTNKFSLRREKRGKNHTVCTRL